MRARKFGLSMHAAGPDSPLDSPGIYIFANGRVSAVADYKKQRQNGRDSDNPKRSFPQDGTFDWVSEEDIASYLKLPPRPGYYRLRYTQSPRDKAWMEERDQNYLARRAREEEQQQDAGAGAATSAAEPVDAADDGHPHTAPTPADESGASATPSEPLASPSSSSATTSPSP